MKTNMMNGAADGEPLLVKNLHRKCAMLGVPVSGTFEITSRCNFSCKMCYIHEADGCAGDELSASEWISLAENAKKAGVLFLLLTGGEPLVRSDFPEIYTALKKMGFLLSVNTNASLIDGDVAELFERNPPCRLNISLYGACEETYKAVTGAAVCEKVKSNILRMANAGIDCRLNCSLTPLNCEDAEKIYAFAGENNLFIKGTSYMYPPLRRSGFRPGEAKERFTPEEAAYYRVKISRMKLSPAEFDKRLELMRDGGCEAQADSVQESAASSEGVRCRAGSSSLWIDSNGKMSACGLFNVNKFDVRSMGFEKAWQAVRESTARIRLPAECVRCEFRRFCTVCAASVLGETGEFNRVPHYLCEMAQFTKKLYLGG